MNEHQIIWLEAHPEKDEPWFQRAMALGFHVHHLDGDKTNNDPLNLVMIEAADHMMIHGRGRTIMIKKPFDLEAALKRGKEAYEYRLEHSCSWKATGEAQGRKSGSNAIADAKKWAVDQGLDWPMDLTDNPAYAQKEAEKRELKEQLVEKAKYALLAAVENGTFQSVWKLSETSKIPQHYLSLARRELGWSS